MSASENRKLLGERLVQAGIISPDQLRIALTEQEGSKDASEPLGRILVRLGFVAEDVMREQLGEAVDKLSEQYDKIA